MKRARFESLDSYSDRIRRCSREIMIASALTLAAVAFLIAALLGGAVTGDKGQDMGQDMGHIAVDKTVAK